jgi:hypothetical protein
MDTPNTYLLMDRRQAMALDQMSPERTFGDLSGRFFLFPHALEFEIVFSTFATLVLYGAAGD